MQLITIILSLIASNVMAQANHTSNVMEELAFRKLLNTENTVVTGSSLEETRSLAHAAVLKMKYDFTYQGGCSHRRCFSDGPSYLQQEGLIWAKVCDKPWEAQYQLECHVGDVQHSQSIEKVVSHHNFQGPKIRLGPNGKLNRCAKIEGTLKVMRRRGDGNGVFGDFEDITDKLSNFNGDGPFDGKDTIFWDKYNMDC